MTYEYEYTYLHILYHVLFIVIIVLFSLLRLLIICFVIIGVIFFLFFINALQPYAIKRKVSKEWILKAKSPDDSFEHVDIIDEFCDLKTSFCLSSYVLSLGTYPYTCDHKDDLEGLEWEEGRDSGRTNETNETSDPVRRDRIKMWLVSSTGLGLHWHCLQVVPGSTEQDAVQE